MNERRAAFNVLLKFANTHKRLDDLARPIVTGGNLTTVQLRLFRQLTSGVIRHKNFLDWQIRGLYKGRFNRLDSRLRVILRMGIFEQVFLESIPSYATLDEYVSLTRKVVKTPRAPGLVNALLRGFLHKGANNNFPETMDDTEKMTHKYSFPRWMIERWVSAWGSDETQKLCRAFNQPPRFTIRVNRSKIDIDSFLKLLTERDVHYVPSDISPLHFRVESVQMLIAAGYFEQGLCSVQDESAAIPVQLLQVAADDAFLDVCAAPGGKFTQVMEDFNPPALAVALDNNLKRLLKVVKNLKRLGLSGYCVLGDAQNLPFKAGIFNKVLIDAPCSGQGVIRKHPDIKWRRSAEEIEQFSNLQKQILQTASQVVAADGTIVYSTCSIDPDEDEVVLDATAAAGMQIQAIDDVRWHPFISQGKYIRSFPSLHNMDGSFAALMKK